MEHVLIPPATPTTPYYECRYAVLREPLGFSRGAEMLDDDEQAIHAWVEYEDDVVAVGRAHLISADSDGSAADHAGPNSTDGHPPRISPTRVCSNSFTGP
jgi:hypothetical protein